MALYTYHARDLKGEDHRGTIETGDQAQVARILGKKGLIVISVKDQTQNGSQKTLDRFFNRVSFDAVVVTTRQLATMIESGLVLSEALDILVDQQESKRFKVVLEDVSRNIKGGLDLATALSKHPDVFPPLYSSLVRAGEQSGKLDVVLQQLATNLERDREFKSKVRGALIYPVLVLGMMFAVMVVMMAFVIPRLTSLYTQSSIDLPLPTKILITTSQAFINFWWLMAMGGVVFVILFKRWISTPRGRYVFDAFLLKAPIISKIIKDTTLTNFNRTFGLLATAGIPLLDALAIVANVIGNSVYKRGLEQTYKGVERGLTFSTQLEMTGIFPKLVSQMFRVGEETGKVDKVAFKMADYFEAESDHMLKNLTVIIEPVVLVLLGLGVAFLVLSIILPIYKLTTTVT